MPFIKHIQIKHPRLCPQQQPDYSQQQPDYSQQQPDYSQQQPDYSQQQQENTGEWNYNW